MIDRDDNPIFLNDFLDYSLTILNKSQNSVKEYNSIFEDEESRLSYEKLCSILFESTFDELTYFFRLSENPNVLV